MGSTAAVGHLANARLKLSEPGAALIRRWETLRTKAYLDTEGIPTIGYGTTSKSGIPVKMGMVITAKQAEDYMQTTIDKIYGAAVKQHVKVPLRQQEYDALCSFVYNVGGGALKSSTLLRKLNKGRYADVPSELMRWTRSKSGNAGRGLRNRRTSEVAMWESAGRVSYEDIAEAHYEGETAAQTYAAVSSRPETPSGDKPLARSTTVQSVGAMVTSAGALAWENVDRLLEWVQSGSVKDYILVAVFIVALLWVAYARLYRDQEALLR